MFAWRNCKSLKTLRLLYDYWIGFVDWRVQSTVLNLNHNFTFKDMRNYKDQQRSAGTQFRLNQYTHRVFFPLFSYTVAFNWSALIFYQSRETFSHGDMISLTELIHVTFHTAVERWLFVVEWNFLQFSKSNRINRHWQREIRSRPEFSPIR